MQDLGLSPLITNELSEIYAWNIDFFRLEKGDNFKILYTSKFIDDSIYIGLNRVHNAYFEHRGKPFYAIEYETDSVRGITEYFDENGKNLRRAFLLSLFNLVESLLDTILEERLLTMVELNLIMELILLLQLELISGQQLREELKNLVIQEQMVII